MKNPSILELLKIGLLLQRIAILYQFSCCRWVGFIDKLLMTLDSIVQGLNACFFSIRFPCMLLQGPASLEELKVFDIPRQKPRSHVNSKAEE